MTMYSETLKPKIDKMFDEINKKVSDAISASPSVNLASETISRIVASSTTSRSKTMLSDLYSALSKDVLDKYSNIEMQNKFFEADLRKEIFDKYDFSSSVKELDYKEINKLAVSTGVACGTMLVGGAGIGVYAILKQALVSSLKVPIAVLIAAAIGSFCVSYFAVTEKMNKEKFRIAISEYLNTVKKDFISWFEEIERYFYRRVEEIMT